MTKHMGGMTGGIRATTPFFPPENAHFLHQKLAERLCIGAPHFFSIFMFLIFGLFEGNPHFPHFLRIFCIFPQIGGDITLWSQSAGHVAKKSEPKKTNQNMASKLNQNNTRWPKRNDVSFTATLNFEQKNVFSSSPSRIFPAESTFFVYFNAFLNIFRGLRAHFPPCKNPLSKQHFAVFIIIIMDNFPWQCRICPVNNHLEGTHAIVMPCGERNLVFFFHLPTLSIIIFYH
jgi:hypothetical protein